MRTTPTYRPHLLVASALCLACTATSGQAARPSPASAQSHQGFVKRVAPFSVLDVDGRPFDFPFLGGFNVPRPQLIDIDGDGDRDVFVQEYTDGIMFFEQTGAGDGSTFAWRSDRFEDLQVGDWYRFVDIDNDDDFDLITEEPFNFIRVYRNDGGKTTPRYTLAVDTLRDAQGEPIFSDRQNIPTITDIDCDNLLDLFIGQLTGTVVRYEEVQRAPNGLPVFQKVTDRFQGIEIVAQLGSRHGANTMAFVDIDADGDQDFFWGDFFEQGLLFIENRGSCSSPDLTGTPTAFPSENPIATSGYNAPGFGDLNGDGTIDILVGVLGGAFNPILTTRDNLLHYRREQDKSFTLTTSRFIRQIDVGSESIPTLVDLDGDGDLDLIVANKIEPEDNRTSRIFQFENTGSRTSPAFHLRGTLEIEGTFHYAPAVGDLNGDGSLDMLLGNWRADLMLLERDRTQPNASLFQVVDSALVTITRGSNTTPALVDIDADGDLDLFIGENAGTINMYLNNGSPTEPRFELVSDEYMDLDVGRRSFPAFTDIDGDGDQDMIVGSDDRTLQLFRNVGTPTAPMFVADTTFALPVTNFGAPTFGDLDGDGDIDIIVGGIGGGLLYFENTR